MAEYKTNSIESGEKMAQSLLLAADILGNIMKEVDMAGRLNSAAITSEPDAYEAVILKGQDVQYALKVLAGRFDRAALAKFKGI